MTTVIWKFPLVVTDVQDIEMPQNAQLLSAHCQQVHQQGQLAGFAAPMPVVTVWALVDDQAVRVLRRLRIVGTGNPAPEITNDAIFVGTVLMRGFVWHVFDMGEVR